MALFYWCLYIFLGTGWFLWSLVGLPLVYSATNSPRTLHSSEECPGTWMIHVFYLLVNQSTYHFLHLPLISPIAAWVLDDAYSPLLFLKRPARLAYVWVDFITRFYYNLVNRFRDFYELKQVNSLLKRNRLSIKSLHIGLFRLAVRHTI